MDGFGICLACSWCLTYSGHTQGLAVLVQGPPCLYSVVVVSAHCTPKEEDTHSGSPKSSRERDTQYDPRVWRCLDSRSMEVCGGGVKPV